MSQALSSPPTPTPPTRYATAAEWWDALGNVPLGRIVFTPPPGTATEADVLRLDDHEDRLCELIDGTLVEKAYDFRASVVATTAIYHLGAFIYPRRCGVISGAAGPMRILPGRVRMPDVAFVSRDRLPGGKSPGVPIPDLSPDLAVEVLSESNTRREMAIKLAEYFRSGTRLVWYVDPGTRSVDVYTAVDQVRRLSSADALDGGDVLPGFSVAVGELFEVA